MGSWFFIDMHLDNYEIQKIGTNLNVLCGHSNACITYRSRVSPPDPRPEGRGPRLFFDFLGRELTFFRNSLQGEGREWEKETPCGKGLGSWDT